MVGHEYLVGKTLEEATSIMKSAPSFVVATVIKL